VKPALGSNRRFKFIGLENRIRKWILVSSKNVQLQYKYVFYSKKILLKLIVVFATIQRTFKRISPKCPTKYIEWTVIVNSIIFNRDFDNFYKFWMGSKWKSKREWTQSPIILLELFSDMVPSSSADNVNTRLAWVFPWRMKALGLTTWVNLPSQDGVFMVAPVIS